jgi:hypothetical protein
MHRGPRRFVPSLLLIGILSVSAHGQIAQSQPALVQSPISQWRSPHAQSVVGLPNVKANETGALEVSTNSLTFSGKSSEATIPLQSVFAVSAGNERVELWGMKGTLLRMAMPNGAGLFAATFMHHRVDMLTVEYGGQDGGYHAAVFFLPAKEAARAAQAIAAAPIAHREPQSEECSSATVEPGSVFVPLPVWTDQQVPAAYRGLLYEQVVARLQKQAGVTRVYRDGQRNDGPACPQLTVDITVTGFKPGNQVVRAATGPAGFFVGTTQMAFDVAVKQADGGTVLRDQVRATVRGETENTKVADSVAKRVAKVYAASEVQTARGGNGQQAGANAFR